MMLKNGTQIATRVIPNGQNGVGSAGILVMPKTDVTNVSGYVIVNVETFLYLGIETYHKEQVYNGQNFDVVPLVDCHVC